MIHCVIVIYSTVDLNLTITYIFYMHELVYKYQVCKEFNLWNLKKYEDFVLLLDLMTFLYSV